MLDVIRRQGNYAARSEFNVIRPIRRPRAIRDSGNSENCKEKYIACQDCLGYFKRDYLRRHRKTCNSRSQKIYQE